VNNDDSKCNFIEAEEQKSKKKEKKKNNK